MIFFQQTKEKSRRKKGREKGGKWGSLKKQKIAHQGFRKRKRGEDCREIKVRERKTYRDRERKKGGLEGNDECQACLSLTATKAKPPHKNRHEL